MRGQTVHLAVATLEKAGKLEGVVTQNIDGLDEMAGTTRVAELHGTTLRNYCLSCGREYSREFIDGNVRHPFVAKIVARWSARTWCCTARVSTTTSSPAPPVGSRAPIYSSWPERRCASPPAAKPAPLLRG